MVDPIFINKLIKDTSRYFCRVKIGNSLIPYTRLKKFNVVDDDNDENITLYNLITSKCDTIKKSTITSYTIVNQKITDNIKNETSFVNRCKNYYTKAKEKGISDIDFFEKQMNENIINNNLQEAIIDFDFIIDHNDIINNVLSIEKINAVKKVFQGIVSKAVEDNKQELFNLIKESDNEEDKEDINSIIEMFDECIEEIDFEDVKTLTELIDCWPPLLMPLPESIEKIKKIKFFTQNNKTKLEEFKDIINNIEDKSVIQEFIEILDKEKDSIPVDEFNKYKAILNEKL